MFKGKPFLVASVIFGGLGLIMVVLTVISFFSGDQLISGAVSSVLHLGPDTFTDSTMAQIAVVLFLPTFIFAYRSFSDSEDEAPAVSVPAPAPAYSGNVRSSVTAAMTAESSENFTSSEAEPETAEPVLAEDPQIALNDAEVFTEPEPETAAAAPDTAEAETPAAEDTADNTTEE